MKKQKEKYDVIKTARITKTQDNELAKLGLSVRDAVEFAIAKKTNPIEKLNTRRQEIEKEIKEHEKKIKQLQEELTEIIAETGVKIEIAENENLDAILDAQKLIDRYSHSNLNGSDKELTEIKLLHFINVGNGKRYLKYLCDSNGGKDKEKYRNEVIEHAKEMIKKQLNK